MKNAILRYFAGTALLWLILFSVGRIVFVLYHFSKFDQVPSSEVFSLFFQALYLDWATTSYLLGLSFLFILLTFLFKRKWVLGIHHFLTHILILAVAFIMVGETALYSEWETKLNYKALTYLEHPMEILQTASTGMLISGFSLITLIVMVGIIFQQKLYSGFEVSKRSWKFFVLFFIVIPPVVGISIRGGLQQIPINLSDAYFSRHYIVNMAAVNPLWNLGHSIEKNKTYMSENPYQFMPLADAKKTVNELQHTPKDTTVKVITNPRPNIVLIILESWTGDIIQRIGGLKGITPRFNQLIDEGLFFEHFYATGARSEQGIAGLLSGFPAQPTTSIIKQPSKVRKLPCLGIDLQKTGYHTSFFFGGQLNYGNLRSYLMYNEFHEIVEEKDINESLPRGKLGIHDEFMFNLHAKALDSLPEPFFSSLFTLSSHSPYDQPMQGRLKQGGEEKAFVNSAYYTDSCLFDYVQKIKQSDWYENSLVILVADHSHGSPLNNHVFSPKYRRIPMLWLGGALKSDYRGKSMAIYGDQTDVPSTLLNQMNLPSSRYTWSKNLFNPTSKNYAYYSHDGGFGFACPGNEFYYYHPKDYIRDDIFESQQKKEVLLKQGKAHLQVLFEEYLSY